MRDADRELFDAIGAQLVLAGLGGDSPRVGNEYAIEAIVGAGGFGLICRATQLALHRKVALKLFALGSDADAGVREALREARSLARLEHPGIVTVHAAGESVLIAGRELACAFVELQFVEGQTLRAWLAEPEREAATIVRVLVEAGRALGHAHAHGVIHRDFKPENVMVDPAGRARVIDFGLALAGEAAIAEQGDWASRDALGTRATSTGLVRGTPGYMAPEASQGLPRAASDQFAFAVVVREALTGRHPFRDSSGPASREASGTTALAARETKPRETKPVVVPRDGEQVFAAIRPLIDRAMSPSPDDRFASLVELCDAIEARLAPRPATPTPARRKPWTAALLGLGLVGAGIVGVTLIEPTFTATPEPEPTPASTPNPDANTSEAPTLTREDLPATPLEPSSCDELDDWAGTWKLGGKVLWTEYAYQLDWWLAYELELELGSDCEIVITARKYRPLVEGEVRSEPVTSEVSVVAVRDGATWRLPLELGFVGDTNTYGNDERYRLALRLDRIEGQPRVSGGFVRIDSEGYPIRTGVLLGRRDLTPELRAIAKTKLDCQGRCKTECAGERAELDCIERACAPWSSPEYPVIVGDADPCGPPSIDFKPPLRARAAKRTIERGEDLLDQSLAQGPKATLLATCNANARDLAGRWAIDWTDASAASGRIVVELSAAGCVVSGSATMRGGESTPITGQVTAAGTWTLVPTTPTLAFPTTLVLVGVGKGAPAFGIDLSEPTRELRAHRVGE